MDQTVSKKDSNFLFNSCLIPGHSIGIERATNHDGSSPIESETLSGQSDHIQNCAKPLDRGPKAMEHKKCPVNHVKLFKKMPRIMQKCLCHVSRSLGHAHRMVWAR